ncbi:MAG: DUF6431 domain-containing protein [Dorea sp.]
MEFFVESSEDTHVCPKCSGMMHYRDSRKRIFKREGGRKDHLIIRRFYCEQCQSLHNELPDCVAPYKHYETELISGVIDGVVTSGDQDSEDLPCEKTISRWLQWFYMNQSNIEGQLRNVGFNILELGEDVLKMSSSLLETLRNKIPEWLETILRIIYNSGGFLPALPR